MIPQDGANGLGVWQVADTARCLEFDDVGQHESGLTGHRLQKIEGFAEPRLLREPNKILDLREANKWPLYKPTTAR